jgi:trimethylamine:corrinoid methyltransferase-like protein
VGATDGGLDLRRAFAQRSDRRAEAQLRAARSAARTAGVRSTPSFRVGRPGGAMRTVTADGLRAAIDDALGA